MYRDDPFRYDAHHHGPGALGWLMFALFLVAVVGFIAVAARWWLSSRAGDAGAAAPAGVPSGPRPADDPLQIVQLRYARGEIGRDEFLQVTADLGGTSSPAPPAEAAT